MAKSDKNFKLSKESKRMLSRLDNPMRGEFKTMLIDAEISFQKAKNAKLSKNKGE